MAILQNSSSIVSTSSCSSWQRQQRTVLTRAAINLPNRVSTISIPVLRPTTGLEELDFHRSVQKRLSPVVVDGKGAGFRGNVAIKNDESDPTAMAKVYAILEAVADRIEMHKNIGEQRRDWNSLLLTSINALTLAAATMAGIAAVSGAVAPAAAVALKVSSTLMYVGATGMLSVVNKIQPSQLAEEQRNATRLFKQIQNQIQTKLCVGNPTAADVAEMMERVLALDKAYPLPLLGAMLEKFPESVEPAVWWPTEQRRRKTKGFSVSREEESSTNSWNGKLEEEMRQVVNVMRIKDQEDYVKLGNKALKLNKALASAAPVLTGLAAVGSALMDSHGGWAAMLGVGGGALASVLNALEHGGQVGMVFEMYRSNAGFFKMMEESIESNLREEDLMKRENGELLEMKVCLQLGRSLSELRDLASSSAIKGEKIDEFASKLF